MLSGLMLVIDWLIDWRGSIELSWMRSLAWLGLATTSVDKQ